MYNGLLTQRQQSAIESSLVNLISIEFTVSVYIISAHILVQHPIKRRLSNAKPISHKCETIVKFFCKKLFLFIYKLR